MCRAKGSSASCTAALPLVEGPSRSRRDTDTSGLRKARRALICMQGQCYSYPAQHSGGVLTAARLQASVTFPSKLNTRRSQVMLHTFSPATMHSDSVSSASLSRIDRSNTRQMEFDEWPACCWHDKYVHRGCTLVAITSVHTDISTPNLSIPSVGLSG